MINVTLPDGSIKEFESGTTVLEVAKSISEGLARNVISAKYNGTTVETKTSLTTDGSLVLFTWRDDEGKKAFWHSTSHVMAQAIQELYPGAKLTIGPAIENGFYYDVDFGEHKVSENDFKKIEDKMLGSSRFESGDKVKVVQGYGSSSSTADVPFGVIEEVPAFAGCEGLKTNEERKACTSDKIREFVAGNFDTKIGKDFLKEGDLVRVIVQFKIDETGNIRDIRAKAPVPELEEEAKRVVNSLPQMTPGKQRGKAVGVVYSLPIVFQNGGGKTSGAANNTAGSLPPPPPSALASK